MKIAILALILCISFKQSFPQKIANEFFVLHNIIRGDSTYDTFNKQVALVKSAGYNGIEINGEESFEGMKAALEKNRFKASYLYAKITLDEPYMDSRMEDFIRQLKGSKTIIAPYIISNRSFPPGSRGADTLVIRILKQLSKWANASGLQVAIYPHNGYYVARTDHAMSLTKKVDQKNLGLSFNLCHWLAATTRPERSTLQNHLLELRPYLKMITICGANDTITQKTNIWDDYILPLGTGSFDTYGLVKYCVKNLNLQVPVGIQCYNIKTNKYNLVMNTMEVWKRYMIKLSEPGFTGLKD